VIGNPDLAIMAVRAGNAQTRLPEETLVNQPAFRIDDRLHATGDHFRRAVIGWIRALWQRACRRAERRDRFVPYY
jgi:hypothetical protein